MTWRSDKTALLMPHASVTAEWNIVGWNQFEIGQFLVACLFVCFLSACSGTEAPPPRDLENVEARLKYLRELGDIAWMEKQPPATILIGWKKYPVDDFGAVNRAAAGHASKFAKGVRIVSIREAQRTLWQQVSPLCESLTLGAGNVTTNCP
jgi:hypothetical protein